MPPDALRQRLAAIANALSISLEPQQADALIAYVGLLERWNATYNLTAVRDPQAMLTQHIADSMAVWQPLRRVAGPSPIRVLDVGSGAGLPGVVLAILDRGLDVVCLDAVGKKMAFVRQVAGELKLPNLQAIHERIERYHGSTADVVCSRAFASLEDFVRLTRQHVRPTGVWLAMKGRPSVEELEAIRPDADVFHVEQLNVPGVEGARCIVWMRPRTDSPVQ